MKKCIVCQNYFKNLSEEHIIPNALGGSLKSKDLTCIECNRKFSDDFENNFVEKYKFLMYMARLKQERGKGKPLNLTTINNEKIRHYSDKIVYERHGIEKIEREDGKFTYKISASSVKEAKQRLDELIKLNPEYKDKLEEQKRNLAI